MTPSRFVKRAAGLALGIAALVPAVALADENTATVETGGPSSTEYAIPLDTARKDAAGGDHKPSGQDDGAPLFGVGVKPDSGSAAPAQAKATPKKHHRARKHGKARKHAAAARPADTITLPTATPASSTHDDGAGTPATIGALTLSVLLLGFVLGSIARRRRA